jgi:hypothetical protein
MPDESKTHLKQNTMDEKKETVVEPKVEVTITPEVVVTEPEVDPIAEKDKEIAALKLERDNYRNVALKRKGKLPGDADFFAGADETTGLTVEETVKQTLIEQELSRKEGEKDSVARQLAKENSELRLALKNRPGESLGGDAGGSSESKDNVFSDAQIKDLTARALRLKVDPKDYIASFKEKLAARA